MGWLQQLLDWLRRKRNPAPAEATNLEVKFDMLGNLTVTGGFTGKDKTTPTPLDEVAATVKVYRNPGRVLMTGGATTWTPPKPHTPGVPAGFSVVFQDVDFPLGANSVVVALVDDEGTENAGVTHNFNVTDQGPAEATNLAVVFTPK